MKGFSEKIFLSLKMPTEEQPVSDHRRLELALQEWGIIRCSYPCTFCAGSIPCAAGQNLMLPQRWYTGKMTGR